MKNAARRLGLVDVLAIGVNAIVGSGVFSAPDDMHRAMGGWSPFAFLLCALVLIPVALCFAELASRHDKTGGPYLYAREAFGREVGYIVGWACYLNAFLSFAANVSLFVALTGLEGHPLFRPAAALVVLGLGAINYVGVKPGSSLVLIMTVGKLSAILFFVGAALMRLDTARWGGALPAGIGGVGTGVYLALFPLQGFEVVPVPAGEVKNPERNIPLATVGSLVFSALLFVVVQAAIVGSYPDIGATSATPLADAARSFGPTIGALVLVGSIVSVGGFSAGSALGSPRYAQALADGGDLFDSLGSVHPRFGTPHIAIVATTALTAALAAGFDYRQLVGFSNVTVVLQYALTCLAVPVLRRKLAEPARFRVPGGAILPIVGAVGSVALLNGSQLEELEWTAAGLGVGLLIFYGRRLFARARA